MITEKINISLDHPIMRGHKVFGEALLPGLAYIDLMYQVFQEHGCTYNELELKHVTIYQPLTVSETDKIILTIQCSESGDGKWSISLSGQKQAGDELSEPILYATAEMHKRAAITFDETIDFNVWKQSARSSDLNDMYDRCLGHDLAHSGMMKSSGRLYETDNSVLIDLSAEDGKDAFLFHPALLDASGIGASGLLAETNRLHLPLYYESFTAADTLQTECAALIRSSAVRQEKELTYMTIEYFNKSGQKVAELKNFAGKAVRDKKAVHIEQAGQPKEKTSEPESADEKEIILFLRKLLAEKLDRPAEKLDILAGYYELGLDSSSLLEIVQDISMKTGAALAPTLLFEYTNIKELAAYLKETVSFEGAENAQCMPSFEAEPADYEKAGDIAIIGMAGRYPKAKNVEEFWENLKAGIDCITEVPKSRWDWRTYADVTSPSGKTVSKWGGFIEDADCFDPQFFRISPREAETMDPQERLFLETCWETIEDAGYTPKTLGGSERKKHPVGVFAGVMHKDYSLIGAEQLSEANPFPVSLNYAQIANRVSYYCDFHGPSIAVDTVCSSSLTAVHLAIESIRSGECEAALAGGVNLSLHPAKYISYGSVGMHSSDGRCRTFGEGGDGYVSGEGVGAVLLKPLQKAEQDGDRIYAVIKGSAVNHVGKVSGITVPSPAAQADVIEAGLKKAGVSPRTVSYVEAHGTGTSLGDPIEIEGLAKAFSRGTQDKQFCSIGSVKSNIGHAESAAGISGLTKAVLQLHHKTLVKSLHSAELNPYVKLDQSPFYVQQETAPWKKPKAEENGKVTYYPRRAGLSSFGASGSNAHIILEEYIPPAHQGAVLENEVCKIIPLSARNKDRLSAYAKKLARSLPEKASISEIAYTLQTGREAMEERVVFFVKDIDDLKQKLNDFANGKENIPDCWRGQAEMPELSASAPAPETDNVRLLAESWAEGKHVDWSKRYGKDKPLKISVPTYPFAKERYWIPQQKQQEKSLSGVVLHPLLQQNTSDFSQQRFTSVFTGDEFFLSDHVVDGKKILPGVAYLEMAGEAVKKAAGAEEKYQCISLKNVVWVRPIIIENEPKEIHIALYPEDNGEITYEIYSEAEGRGEDPVIHSQGEAVITAAEEVQLDIASLQAQCGLETVTADECYDAFHKIGLDYGAAYRGVQKLLIGEDRLLANISLPSAVQASKQQYTLHPSIMDAAFHASIGLLVRSIHDNAKSHQLSLPFALQEVEVLGECPEDVWSYIRYSEGSKADDKVRKFDIDICDDTGTVYVRMKGASVRALDNTQTGQPPVGHTMMIPAWEPIAERFGEAKTLRGQAAVFGGTESQRTHIKRHLPNAAFLPIRSTDDITSMTKMLEASEWEQIIWVAPQSDSADSLKEQERNVFHIFKLMKALLTLGYGEKNLNWFFVTEESQPFCEHDGANPSQAAICGLAGTMAKEYPHWNIRVIDTEKDGIWPISDVISQPAEKNGQIWAYRHQQLFERQLIPLANVPTNGSLYKTGGVYVVIGGAGYLGEAWSEYMIRRYQARVIWIGRSRINESIQAKLDRLAAYGPAPEYVSADAADSASLQQAYNRIKERCPHINGIIHSAMDLSEQSLNNMELDEFRSVLKAKADVSVSMAKVFEQEPLDFVLFFSSLVAFIHNVKQSHYASGCAFSDAFAKELGVNWNCPVKVMNWGYWGNSEAAEDGNFVQLMDQIGLGLIEPDAAMEALEALLTMPLHQAAFIHTTKPVAVEGMSEKEQLSVYTPQPLTAAAQLGVQPPDAETLRGAEHEELDDFLYHLLIAQLKEAGLLTPKSMKAYKPEHVYFKKWLKQSVAFLLDHRYLDGDMDSFTLSARAKSASASLWQEWERRKAEWLNNADTKAMAVLAETMLKALPDILRENVPATDIMFPHSSMELVEGIYKHNQVADYFNNVLSDTLTAYVKERISQDSEAAIRILEIGAGTGGTSAGIFEKLKPYQNNIKEYCYTDLSKAFLVHAETEYGEKNPYLTYKIFNAEAPLSQQDIDPGAYDIVVAANVLHATKDIRQTLRNAKAVLKHNGLLLLNEMAGNSLFPHITFGLLEGWWLHEDTKLRIPGCPGLYPESWKQVLESEGYRAVYFPAEAAHDLSHQIVAANSNGIVRQALQAAAEKRDAAPKAQPAPHAEQETAVRKSDASLKEKSTEYMKTLIGETLKIPPGHIDSKAPLEKYGIDSIVVVQLTNTLRNVLDQVSSTLFFEYQTIDALVERLIKTKRDAMIKLTGAAPVQEEPETASKPQAAKPVMPLQTSRRYRREKRVTAEPPPHSPVRDVAIIGVSGRYPQAKTAAALWDNIKKGKNCIEEIPKDRWNWQDYYDEEKGKEGSIYTKWGGFIEDMDKFDPLFFQISPLEAERMDPQERLFLETAYASIEDAGYTPENLCQSRKIGVFAGAMNKNYPTGYGYWSIANRVSYLFDFQGPSIAVDTACSSSLTAIHLALESIYSGSSECAVAGGVNIVTDPIHYMNLSVMNMLSASDTCKSFGDRADGFVDGEGVGAVVLKPLDKAISDNDHIYGVIKGSTLNSGGKTNGYTVPNPNAQAALIKEALQRANVPARTVSYIEAHGTGTALGDPIEIAGLTKAFEEETTDRQFCAIGSAKSNIGHCESAAGIAGLTKILFQLKDRKIAPSLHAEQLNPNIDFAYTPFIVQQELGEWKRPVIDGKECPRRAGLSSFGAGGANAHLVIEEYIADKEPVHLLAYSPALIVLSAKNSERLNEKAKQLTAAIRNKRYSDSDLINMAYTLQTGRIPMEERLGVIVYSLKELEEKLNAFITGEETAGVYRDGTEENKRMLSVFAADEDMEAIIDAWIRKGKYSKLLELWVKGVDVNWAKLYGDIPPARISLPAYPFAKERFWHQQPAETKAVTVSKRSAEKDTEEHFEVMAFREVLKEQAVPQAGEKKINTLISFLSDPQKQQAAVSAVRSFDSETKIIFIAQGDRYEAFPSGSYQVVRKDPHSYEKAFTQIQKEHGEASAVLYLWALEDKSCIEDYSCIVNILKAMARAKLQPERLLLAGAFETGLERCYLESWIGFERSLGIVLPKTNITGLFQKAGGTMADWMEKIWAELKGETEHTAFCEKGKRYVYHTERAQLSPGNNRIRTGGTYLITGGLGGLGYLFARHLARNYQANVVLTGRSPINEKKKEKMKELMELGAGVIYAEADVCDPIGMGDCVKRAKERFGAIHGVIHAAGIESKTSIFEKEIEDFRHTIEPKVKGSLLLDEWLKDETPDFICYFSSTSAVLGDFGCCDYAAANRFQMAYAQYKNEQSDNGKAFVINWPVWKNGGMGVGDEETTGMYLKSSGQRLLETEEGIDLFERIISQENAQYLVIAGKRSRAERFLGIRQQASEELPAPSETIASIQAESVEERLETDMKELIHSLIKISKDKLVLHKNWAEFGFDSIYLAKFAVLLSKHYSIEVTPALFYSYATLEELMKYYLTEHKEAIERFYRTEEAPVQPDSETASPENKEPYTDQEIIAMMKQVSEGTLDFERVQDIIEGSKTYES
ncbi:SDR family NAD(P)-dependent oxidoreductase [Bacillus nakamurai]|uniref:SDR family NAD(P)-dependent oxidoreductase n=1 Tax=Bacillus nakamurai TaxID=1793963 RepID=UPI0020C4BE25|nr:SDR family NAD(P)-dependent oxidoreductase [Bacillus nakamurai]MCP6681311.1 SDR family NAD(P)-dependent oxidoreductase [Bacillus nakamurai]